MNTQKETTKKASAPETRQEQYEQAPAPTLSGAALAEANKRKAMGEGNHVKAKAGAPGTQADMKRLIDDAENAEIEILYRKIDAPPSSRTRELGATCEHINKEWRVGNWTCVECGYVTRQKLEADPEDYDIEKLVAQRDELLAALKGTLDALYNETCGRRQGDTQWIIGVKSAAKRAISNAEGRAQ